MSAPTFGRAVLLEYAYEQMLERNGLPRPRMILRQPTFRCLYCHRERLQKLLVCDTCEQPRWCSAKCQRKDRATHGCTAK